MSAISFWIRRARFVDILCIWIELRCFDLSVLTEFDVPRDGKDVINRQRDLNSLGLLVKKRVYM